MESGVPTVLGVMFGLIRRDRWRRALSMVALLAAVAGLACPTRPAEKPAAPDPRPAAAAGAPGPATDVAGVSVNDVQSRLNTTVVREIATPATVAEIQAIVRRARAEHLGVSIAGGRHAMGGQQFGSGTLLIDMSKMNRVLRFDPEKGIVEAEAGIQWPELIAHLLEAQEGRARQWGISQKQTGADRLSLGGALSANVHGRGLALKPIIGDVESFALVDADGEVRRCSRAENAELFRLAIGGYGLFGVIAQVELRLVPRRKVERVVEVIPIDQFLPAVQKRIAAGFLYGDFQYNTDAASDDFLKKGVFSTYRPVPDATSLSQAPHELSTANWNDLSLLAHVDKKKAFERYAAHYLSTSGQVYWSDTHQLSLYLEDYHQAIDARLDGERGTEMITEIYVPRPALVPFMADVREDFRSHDVNVIYGTVRLIEKDDESILAWARQPWVCIIFNLHVVHTPQGLERSAADFRRLIDLAIKYDGSYYLTYHRWATREQIERCHPRFAEFLALKKKFDPEERFQSEWYRHNRELFAAR